jgi:hypothetical protein
MTDPEELALAAEAASAAREILPVCQIPGLGSDQPDDRGVLELRRARIA